MLIKDNTTMFSLVKIKESCLTLAGHSNQLITRIW